MQPMRPAELTGVLDCTSRRVIAESLADSAAIGEQPEEAATGAAD